MRRDLYNNLRKIEEELLNDYSSKACRAGLTVTVKKKAQALGKDSVETSASPEKRIILDESFSYSPNSRT